MAEVFSSLTRIPAHPRLNSEAALKMIESTRKNLSWVDLKASDYENALSEAVKKSVIGGTFYDLLHIQCARKVAAERIYTWNTKHFLRIAPDLAPLILSP